MKTRTSFAKLTELSQTTEGYTRSFDGTRIWYKSIGTGSPIIFCNGLGCSTFYFNYLINYFKKTHQVIIWDYRGHGKSESPKIRPNFTIQSLVKDLKAVYKATKVEKAVLIGHSMGTQVVFEFYNQNPEMVRAIVSCFGTFGKPIDTFYNTPLSKYAFEVIYAFNHLFPKLSNKLGGLLVKNPLWFQVGGLLNMLKPYLVDKTIMKEYLEHITNVEPIFLSNLTRSLQEHNAEDQLKGIKLPVLIFGAEDDTFTPLWISKKMHHLIPGSELFVVKKGTHVALVEQPELINLRIEKFLIENVFKSRRMRKTKADVIPLKKKASTRASARSFPSKESVAISRAAR